ncbi:hypothetical protein EG349_10195 [Chryseobacterium shandongense]|uniref:DUF3164 family protein n=2 Tax=Chryseobacterium TaxID=59732 RepID=A0AAD0YES5_9FLAO|nr:MULTISPECIES: hypothetical protein [Chryseobacterium]AZA87129.1 hypothetical protein EG349_10195 [Chryseobacterium shandongense]AZA95558.1 hypothetical protein EG353_08270 [Chryseobacterium shandongense]MEC3876160.1 hypothetical protein [Chryseobacterium sp. T9W2-O]
MENTIKIPDLTPEQMEAVAAKLKEAKKKAKEKLTADKKILKGLEDSVVVENIDYFIDVRTELESRILGLFANMEQVIELRAGIYGNKKREQDTHTFTLDDGSASIKVGWNTRTTFNGTEAEGIVKIKQYMAALAGETENEKILMEFLNIALKTDVQGNYDPKKVRELNKMRDKANSDLFNEGMDIIIQGMIDIRTSRVVTGYKMVDFGEGNKRRVNFTFSID